MIDFVVICGPTASGKSKLGLELAKLYNGNIINCDSQQIIKELPILTDQPDEKSLEIVPHFLYGYKSASDKLTCHSWILDCVKMVRESIAEGRLPILVGGSGFYIYNLLNGYVDIPEIECEIDFLDQAEQYNLLQQHDPELKVHPNDEYRTARAAKVLLTTGKTMSWWMKHNQIKPMEGLTCKTILLWPPKDVILRKCTGRLDDMFPSVVDEVRLAASDPTLQSDEAQANLMKAIGFRHIENYIQNEIDLQTTKERILLDTMQYAKRQKTWFRNKMQFDHVFEDISDMGRMIRVIEEDFIKL